MGARNTITAALLPIHVITDDEIDGGTQDTAFDANPKTCASERGRETANMDGFQTENIHADIEALCVLQQPQQTAEVADTPAQA